MSRDRRDRRQRLAVGAVLPLALFVAGCGTTVSGDERASAGSLPSGATGAGGTSGGGPGAPGTSPEGGSAPGGFGPDAPQPGAPSTTSGHAPAGSSGGVGLTQPPRPPGQGPVVTKPLTVGLLGISAVGGAADGVGYSSNQSLTPSQALRAVAASYKDGVAGRPLRIVFAEIDPTGDYQQQLNAACAKFTQDNHVDVVVSVDAANDEVLATCLDKARIPRISTGYGSSNAASFVKYPLSRHVGAPNADRRMATLITRSAAARTLTTASRVGVIVEDCPRNRSVYEQTVVPALKKVGVAGITVQFADCVHGFTDAGPASAATSGAVLSFASNQVDTVMFVSNFEGTLLLFFSQAAENQRYRPRYRLTSAAGVADLAGSGSVPTNQLRNMGGWGWLPTIDESRGNRAGTSAQRACILRLSKAGTSPKSNVDYLSAYAACDGFTALERGLQGSRGDSSAGRLLPALDAASTSLSLASVVDGRIVLDARRHDGPSRVRSFTYQTTCGCFVYVGSSRDMSP